MTVEYIEEETIDYNCFPLPHDGRIDECEELRAEMLEGLAVEVIDTIYL